MKLHTYLNYGGNCEQAFRFYEKHLGGKVTIMMTQAEPPTSADAQRLSLPLSRPKFPGKISHLNP